jgi:DNA-binding transcriptional ArsR family regulator
MQVEPMHALMKKPPVIRPETLRGAAGQVVGVLKLLANEDRLLLLCQLSQGEMCVGELEETLGIRQPTLSQQLGVLRGEGVVDTRREGKNIFYSVADPALLEVVALLHRLYCPKESR